MSLVNKSFRNIISPISFLSRNFLNLWSNKQLGFLLYKHKRLESLYLLQNLIFKLFLAFIILFILFLARKSRYNGLDAKTSNWYFFKIFPKYSSNWFFFFFDIQTTSYSAIVRLVLLNINYDVSVVSFLLVILYMLLIIHSDQFIVSQCFIASG